MNIIIDFKDVIEMCGKLEKDLGPDYIVDGKCIIESLLVLGKSEKFDISYWEYIESKLTPEQLDSPNINRTADLITEIIDMVYDQIGSKFLAIMGEKEMENYEFLAWTRTAICVRRKDTHAPSNPRIHNRGNTVRSYLSNG
jgi:hypothetical protein